MRSRNTKSGFTLIELLVVIAVIAVLVSILLPALSLARTLARRNGCASNLRQMGSVLQMYNNDHSGHYPEQNTLQGSWSYGDGMSALYPEYVKEPRVFWCPADRGNPLPTDINTNYGNVNNSAQVSYMYVYAFQKNSLNNPPDRAESPVSTPIGEDQWGGSLIDYPDWCNHSPEGGNVLFLDGHVRWAPVLPYWNPMLWPNCYMGPP